MKKVIRSALAALLALAILTAPALASYALGDELHGYEIPLAEGASLFTQMFWSNSKSDLRTENYVSFRPNSALAPKVSYGNNVLNKQSVSAMAAGLESQGKRVLSGINGDYFVMATGDPLGIVITDGILRSSASYLQGVGFLPDGSAIIGKPDLNVTAHFGDMPLKVAEVNKLRTDVGFYLFSSDFADTTKNTKPGIEVILAPVMTGLGETVADAAGNSFVTSDKLKIGGRVSMVVEQVLYDPTTPTPIPPGKFVLSVNRSAGQFLQDTLAAVSVGQQIDIDISSPDARWNQVDCAIGAMYRILADGQVQTGLDNAAAPRTAVGVKADGSVIYYTIDGRQSGLSVGASMTQVAQRLLELGCVDAVCLDGGGSTTLGATDPGSNGFEQVNSSSDKTQRLVTNGLFLVSTLGPSGTPARLHCEPEQRVLLSGGSTKIASSLVDSNWFPLQGSEALSYAAARGSFAPDGTYTAPAEGGTDTLTLTTASGLSGSTSVTVFSAPTAISVKDETTGKALTQISLSGGESVQLTASAAYKMLPLTAQDESFGWSLSPANLGTISPNGSFTAGTVNGSGSLQVSAGGFTASIPLSVANKAEVQLLEDFEGTDNSLRADTGATLSFNSLDQDGFSPEQLRFGRQSLRFAYDTTQGPATLTSLHSLRPQLSHLSLWVYGDQSNATLTAKLQDAAGQPLDLDLGLLDFSGWKRLVAQLPAGATSLTGLALTGGSTGTIYLDQLTLANGQSDDTKSPDIALSLANGLANASLSDNNLSPLREADLSYLVDGQSTNYGFTFAPDTGLLLGDLPQDGAYHRISVVASDASGNQSRASVPFGTAPTDSGFSDMHSHWAKGDVAYLSALGIVKGEESKNGLVFRPDASITRGDFALMIARSLGLSTTLPEGAQLPFADAHKIPTWSRGAVYALYQRGLMKGSAENGKLSANATAAITRAEAMSILGRSQPQGYAAASLGQFGDAAAIPAWASGHLSSLVAQGVVGGFEGKIRPLEAVSRAELCKMLASLH